MSTLNNTLRAAAAASVTALLFAMPANAQEPTQQTCTAEVQPQAIQQGEKAVRLDVKLSTNVGGITGLTASPDAGIRIASPADLPRQEMAAGEEQPAPVEMGADRMTWTVWLSTAQAEAGVHEILFATDAGACEATLEVESGSEH